ncbi:hypothetical protein FRB90_011703 [Tulasnella sp. 427]|nr:hypothetical protein FRB90_011703 [Tulasnella sp. 427]
MRFFLVVLFAASVVSAVSIFKRDHDKHLPECARKCVAEGNPSPCKHDDTACICLNVDYGTKIEKCVEDCCSKEDAKAAAEAGIAYCKAVGIDPEHPFPKCAIPCVTENASACQDDNGVCLCKNKKYLGNVVRCLKNSCWGDDLKTTARVGEAYCRAAGFDISSIIGSY